MPRKWLVPLVVVATLLVAGLGLHLFGHRLYHMLLALHGVRG